MFLSLPFAALSHLGSQPREREISLPKQHVMIIIMFIYDGSHRLALLVYP